jgi:hypothetical protein
MRSMIAPLAMLAGLFLPGLASAQSGHSEGGTPAERPRSEAAHARYPQLVRAGDLRGRLVIEDTQQQRVLGRAVAATRSEDGKLGILMEYGGVLGFGARRIVVPMEAIALLGQLLVLKDLDPGQLAALPGASPQPSDLLPPDTVVRMGLARN